MRLPVGRSPHQESFRSLLRKLRIRAGLTQQHLADLSTLSVRAIRDLESGRVHRPRLETVRLLADGLALEGGTRSLFVASATEAAESDTGDDACNGAFMLEDDLGTTIARVIESALMSTLPGPVKARPAPPEGAVRQVSMIRLDGGEPRHIFLEIWMWRGSEMPQWFPADDALRWEMSERS
ncbi:helix-turn-helix transcriptional regulator [Nonomuraea sp. 3-1Str]|uniref:helix-turn-helix transcriptional regulator n=1 Tax=Nonomuraea sp. 3-1Str TaxID=2929801 RepID=UPI0028637CEF|nr:helix-turn-helix transcriptional regulator [Nonomuraea sp. 3-1Str]MDR8414097.1 helix-turn-helix transcriptional regulator [Nonomuraea sp. 3-1Str]